MGKFINEDEKNTPASNPFRHWIEHVQSSPYPLIRLVNGSELRFRSIGYEAELIRGKEYMGKFIGEDEKNTPASNPLIPLTPSSPYGYDEDDDSDN